LGVPEYLMTSEGPDHEKSFTARACVNGQVFEACVGRSKKEAEQGAAESAWRGLTASDGDGGTGGSDAESADSSAS
jgi:ribonuclease-3